MGESGKEIKMQLFMEVLTLTVATAVWQFEVITSEYLFLS